MIRAVQTVIFRLVRFLVWLFSPTMKVEGLENLPEGGAVIVGNHAQMYGPIAAELHFPGPRRIWCAGQMMHLKEVPDYAFTDFWPYKPGYIRWFFRLLSYVIAPLSVCIFNCAFTIPVYHDSRVLTTFRSTVDYLRQGTRVVIFPEHDQPRSNILYDFQDRFIDLGRLYYRKTGEALIFVPMYVAPRLKKMVLGKPVRFDPSAPIEGERHRICEELMREITDIAVSLPEHVVIPYRNIAKKDYPHNIPLEVYTHEETCG